MDDNSITPIPTYLGVRYGSFAYFEDEITTFLATLQYETPKSGSKLFLVNKNISQDKIREAGFLITRDPKKADLIVFDDIYNEKTYSYFDNPDKSREMISFTSKGHLSIESLKGIAIKTSKFVTSKSLYKFLYKYEGNLDLYKQISELLESNNGDNIKLAMEFMANANWENNEIYLEDIFSRYYIARIRGSQYKNSISFKGFLNSLNFRFDRYSWLNTPDDYRELCKTQEHHDFVYDKFKTEFEEKLSDLFKEFKIKIDELKYSIDKNIYSKKEDEDSDN